MWRVRYQHRDSSEWQLLGCNPEHHGIFHKKALEGCEPSVDSNGYYFKREAAEAAAKLFNEAAVGGEVYQAVLVLDVRQADNCLDADCWSINRLVFVDCGQPRGWVVAEVKCLFGEPPVVCEGLDGLEPGFGWNLERLRKWAGQDYTGSHPEPYNEVGITVTIPEELPAFTNPRSRQRHEEELKHAPRFGAGNLPHRFVSLHPAEEEALWGPFRWCDSCGRDIRDCENPEHRKEAAHA